MAKIGRIRWLMVVMAMIVAAVSYLDRANISIAAPFIKVDLGLNDKQLGIIFSAFAVGYALSQPFAGRLADRYGPLRTIACGMVLWSVLTSITAMVSSSMAGALGVLLGVRLLLGVGESVIFPAANRLVANWIPPKERGLANGLVFAAVGIGGGMAPPLITAAISMDGWRWGFWICAMLGVVMLAVWLIVVRDRPEDHKWATPAERAFIEAGKAERGVVNSNGLVSWATVIGNRQVLLLTISYFCFGYVAFMFSTWFFIYISSVRGLDLKSSGIYATLPFIGMAIASPLGGVISDWLAKRTSEWNARCLVAAIGMFMAGGFLAFAPQVADARLASFVLACGSGSMYLSQSAFWTLSANLGRSSAGSVSGFMNMGCQLGAVAVSFATPFIKDAWGWSAPFVVTGILAAIGGAAWLLIDPTAVLREEPGDRRADALPSGNLIKT